MVPRLPDKIKTGPTGQPPPKLPWVTRAPPDDLWAVVNRQTPPVVDTARGPTTPPLMAVWLNPLIKTATHLCSVLRRAQPAFHSRPQL